MSPSSKRDTQPTLRSRRREATRLEILAAAREVFAERGYYDVRMDDVADRAGVSVGTLYNYFTDRATLLHALLLKHQEELLAALDAKLAACDGQTFQASLLAFVSCILNYAEADRTLIAIITEGGSTEQADAEIHQTFMQALFERAQRLMALSNAPARASSSVAALYPCLLLGAIRGTVMHHLRGKIPDLASAAGPIVDVMLHGMQGVAP